MAINPNDVGALGLIGTGLIYAGDPENGRRFAEKAIERAGPAALSFWWGAIGDHTTRKENTPTRLSFSERTTQNKA